MHTIYPKYLVDIKPEHGPLFFLAGPVYGGDDWQTACCEQLKLQMPTTFQVAIPWPAGEKHRMMAHELKNIRTFTRQLDWERYYLACAAGYSQDSPKAGCVIFWLPEESKSNPRPGGDYAMDSRGEIGRFGEKLSHTPSTRVVFGGEAGFKGMDTIKRNLDKDTGTDYPMYPTLEETVRAAIKMAGLVPQ